MPIKLVENVSHWQFELSFWASPLNISPTFCWVEKWHHLWEKRFFRFLFSARPFAANLWSSRESDFAKQGKINSLVRRCQNATAIWWQSCVTNTRGPKCQQLHVLATTILLLILLFFLSFSFSPHVGSRACSVRFSPGSHFPIQKVAIKWRVSLFMVSQYIWRRVFSLSVCVCWQWQCLFTSFHAWELSDATVHLSR